MDYDYAESFECEVENKISEQFDYYYDKIKILENYINNMHIELKKINNFLGDKYPDLPIFELEKLQIKY